MKISRILRYQQLRISRLYREKPYPFIFAAFAIVVLLGSVAFIDRSEPEIEQVDFGDLPDFQSFAQVDEMKAEFFDYLQPIVEYHNGIIAQQRKQLLLIQREFLEGEEPSDSDKEFLSEIAEEYDYEMLEGWNLSMRDASDPHPLNRVLRRLLLRVDEIPVDLALVQAAKESGWGRSRFAVEANNLFGHWCYSEGCGLVPERRSEGAAHEVRKFESVANAIGSYMKNLNSYYTYETLRLIRGGLRSADDPVTGMALADGLIYYSQRREAYVDEIKVMIRQYHEFQQERHTDS